MRDLMGLLIPLIFVAIAIINVVVRLKLATKNRPGEKKRSAWSYLANPEELRKFLEETGGVKPTRRPPSTQRPTGGAPVGMPVGTVTPTRRRLTGPIETGPPAAPQEVPPASVKSTLRTPGENIAERETHAHTEDEHLVSHGSQVGRRAFEGSLKKRLRGRSERADRRTTEPKNAALPDAPLPPSRAQTEPKTVALPDAPLPPSRAQTEALGVTVEASEPLAGSFTRRGLRRAVVMSEILGRPVAMR
jgi:hypothetical protein